MTHFIRTERTDCGGKSLFLKRLIPCALKSRAETSLGSVCAQSTPFMGLVRWNSVPLSFALSTSVKEDSLEL
jgi:hypothetical protein